VEVRNATGIILAAGLGQRMGAITATVPKPLLPVLNCPLVGWIMAIFRGAHIREIAMNIHHLSAAFADLPEEVAELDISLRLVSEAELTGPFGGVIACCTTAAEQSADVLVFAGDAMYEVNVADLFLAHRTLGALLTVGVTTVHDGHRYGVLDVDNKGLVCGMREKPHGVGRVETASCGIYIVSPGLIDLFRAAGRPLDWVDVVNDLLRRGERVAAVSVAGWIDAGTSVDLLRLNQELLLVPEILSRVAEPARGVTGALVWTQGHRAFPRTVEFEGTVLIGEGSTIGERSFIADTVVGPGAIVGSESILRGTMVLPGAMVPERVTIIDQIVA
jgi:NDP-sugar pyrophosphorylase family protein